MDSMGWPDRPPSVPSPAWDRPFTLAGGACLFRPKAGRGAGGEGASRRIIAACLLLACAAQAPALELAPAVAASLWAERDGIAPGQSFTLGLRLLHAPGWHSYWAVPGDSGLPTRLSWRLPPGFRAGAIQWPAPRRLPIGPLVDYGYEGDTLLLTELQAAPDLPLGGDVRIEVRAQWLMCRDVCIPGSKDLSVTLPVRPAQALRATANAPAFEHARERVPRDLKLALASATRSGTQVSLAFAAPAHGIPHRLDFFPLEPGRIEASAPQTLRTSGNMLQLGLTAAQPVGSDFRTLRGVLEADGGPDAGGWAATIEVPLTE
jgi:DsbC/DsbD-like thiol-disulfide interchange protein